MALTFHHFIYTEEFPSRLDRWLKRQYEGCTQGMIEKAIRKRFIRINSIKVESSTLLNLKDRISVEIHLHQDWIKLLEKVPTLSKNIHYSFEDLIFDQTQDFLILNKPSGLDVQGGKNVSKNIDDWLKVKSKDYRLVHRIDRATSGLLIVAKNLASAVFLTHLFREHKIEKTYRAIVWGRLDQIKGDILLPVSHKMYDLLPKGKEQSAQTHFEVLFYHEKENWSDVQLTPLTGRKHQLRIHMSALGHPIMGDQKYDLEKKTFSIFKTKKVLFLHAWKLTFKDQKKKLKSWTSPLPSYWPYKV